MDPELNRREFEWVWEQPNWPHFTWDKDVVSPFVSDFLLGAEWQSGALSFVGGNDLVNVSLDWLTDEMIETSAIEGEALRRDSVRASLLHYLGLGVSPHDSRRRAEQGMAELAADLYETFDQPLTHDMLFQWHLMVVQHDPAIREIASYRSGPESVRIVTLRHEYAGQGSLNYLGPPGTRVAPEMDRFVEWFNGNLEGATPGDALALAGIAHLYFECIHPFEDGNGRIGRAIAEKALAMCLGRPSLIPLSRTINKHRSNYYRALESCKASLNANTWQQWFARTTVEALAHGRQRLVRYGEQARLFSRIDSALNDRQRKALMRMFREEPDGFRGGMSAGNYQTITGAASATATRDLGALVDLGALRRTGKGKGTRYWLNLLELDKLRRNPHEPGFGNTPQPSGR